MREDAENTMNDQFKSGMVDDLKNEEYKMERDGVTVYLAKVCNYWTEQRVWNEAFYSWHVRACHVSR